MKVSTELDQEIILESIKSALRATSLAKSSRYTEDHMASVVFRFAVLPVRFRDDDDMKWGLRMALSEIIDSHYDDFEEDIVGCDRQADLDMLFRAIKPFCIDESNTSIVTA
ncbi:MAG: hypothetical protein RIC85_00645 [Gammaproteobacteria bacterium]